MRRRHSFLESARFLVVIGVLAGALGGLAIGVVTGKVASSSAATAH